MIDPAATKEIGGHSHVFLGEGHEKNERKTWAVIALCSAMADFYRARLSRFKALSHLTVEVRSV